MIGNTYADVYEVVGKSDDEELEDVGDSVQEDNGSGMVDSGQRRT